MLSEHHWLCMPLRVQFCLSILVYHCLHGNAPSYLAETLHVMSRHVVDCSPGQPRHHSFCFSFSTLILLVVSFDL